MKMVTRCPACGTAFRIYQAQLDARQGQVRCGHCAVVFSAHEHLVVEPEAKPAPPHASPPQEPAASVTPAAPADPPPPEPPPETPPAPAKETVEAKAAPAPEARVTPAQAEAPGETATRTPSTERASTRPERKPEPVELTMADATQFDFGPAAQASQRIGPWWTVTTVALIALLFLQGLYLFRTELARALPMARPALERICEAVGCDVPYPREASLISLEASDLQAMPDQPDVLRLSAVLRNRATFAQMFPAIELTLTDERNATVARRVLRPRDYMPKQRPDVFEPTTELPLELHIDAVGLGASGYRLYVFYP